MVLITGKAPKEERLLQVGSNKFELVDFRLYEYEDGSVEPSYEGIYGINIAKVQEINLMSTLTKLPNAHECIAGVLERREEAIPIINLSKFLGYKNNIPKADDNIIICEFNHLVVGFIVHLATKIRRISWEKIVPPTQLTHHEVSGGCITGMYKLEHEKMLLILDFERIVAEINGETEIISRYEEEKAAGDWDINDTSAPTVLVVDDSNTARMQSEMHLTQLGLHVITATDGQDALDTLESIYNESIARGCEVYDLLKAVISDVEMPRIDGFALAQKIRKDPRFEMLPIIMNTSLSGKSNMVQSENLADDYIVKFSPNELKASCDRLIKELDKKRDKIKGIANK